jgi:hypothetical protein
MEWLPRRHAVAQTVKIKTAQSHQTPRLERDVRVEAIEDLRATVKAVRDAWLWIEQLLSLRRMVAKAQAEGDDWEIQRPVRLLSGPSGQEVQPWSDDMFQRMPSA